MDAAKLLAALMSAHIVEMATDEGMDDLIDKIKSHVLKRVTPEQYRLEMMQEIKRTIKVQQAALAVVSRENTAERELVGLETCLYGDDDPVITIATYRNPINEEYSVVVRNSIRPADDRTYNAPDGLSAHKIVEQIHDKMDSDAREAAIKAVMAETEEALSKAKGTAPDGS